MCLWIYLLGERRVRAGLELVLRGVEIEGKREQRRMYQ